MIADPAKILREHGLQVTAQRLAVLRAVSGRPHSTADAVAEDVRAEIGVISRQAVYDALGMLAEKGTMQELAGVAMAGFALTILAAFPFSRAGMSRVIGAVTAPEGGTVLVNHPSPAFLAELPDR